jgi:predicted PurR-regulated permease PerM
MNNLPPQKASGEGLRTTGWLIVLIWGLATARAFLIPICISALLAFLVIPIVTLMRKRRVPEWIAVICAALVLLLPIAGIVYALVREGQTLVQDFPSIMTSFNHALSEFAQSSWATRLGISSEALDLKSLAEKIGSRAGEGIAFVIGGLSIVMDASSQAALVLIFALLMVASRRHLRASGEKILARVESIQAARLLDEVTTLIERFLVARLLIVAFIGAVDAIALRAFGVNYSFLLGAFFGVMTLVPAVGFIIALIPTLIVALATGHSIGATLVVTGILVAMSIVEGNILSPKLVGQKLNINALTCFIGLFAGGLLWGIWGMLLSVPILGVMRIVFSAVPDLQPWGDLLADKEDHSLANSMIAFKLKKKPD